MKRVCDDGGGGDWGWEWNVGPRLFDDVVRRKPTHHRISYSPDGGEEEMNEGRWCDDYDEMRK